MDKEAMQAGRYAAKVLPITLLERFKAHQQRWQENYRSQAPTICAKYGLDMEADAATVKELIRAEREQAKCLNCSGGECPKTNMRYIKPEIYFSDYYGRWQVFDGDCPAAIKRRRVSRGRHIVPAIYADKTFDDYEVTSVNQRAVALAHWFLEKGTRGLYYFGGCGCGKTFLASLIALEYVGLNKRVVFGDVPTLLQRIKNTFNNREQSTESIIESYVECDLLIMDDIGSGYVTDWNVGILYTIINDRYNAKRPIILTSNYDLDGLEAKLSKAEPTSAQRIVSRLRALTYAADLGQLDRRG